MLVGISLDKFSGHDYTPSTILFKTCGIRW